MTNLTSVQSNAFNFMSYLQGGVDPRTGQYTVSITLPEVKTNGLRGPVLPLVLSYNPLNVQDSGFGLGWNLQLSQYNPGTQIVSLSSGETFKATDILGDQLLMPEKKLDSFHLYDLKDGRYRVVHRSGQVEILQMRGSQGNQMALPVRIYAPEGHGVTLDYAPFASHQMLSKITDDSGQLLLEITRDSTSVRILPHGAQGADAEFVMFLSGSDRNVERIELPTDNKASWRFTYNLIRGHSCMVSVETPVGGHEDVFYLDDGHQFPAKAGRDPLPRVTRHLTRPGFGQPLVDVQYSYKDNHNFLGGGLDIAWAENGLDNLYRYTRPYEYSSTETLQVNGTDARSIERVFNRFHLLIRETTRQQLSIYNVETDYYIEAEQPFYAQPAYCQLPKEVRTSWRLSTEGSVPRTETVSSRYDSHGNLLAQTQANGVVENSEWYPASGEDGCPQDPYGFVRSLKSTTVVPAQSDHGLAPTLITRYRYKALPAVAGSLQRSWLAPERETLLEQTVDGEQELQRTAYEHHLDTTPAGAFQYGRVRLQTVTMGGQSTETDYVYSAQTSPAFQQTVLRTVQTVTGFDRAKKVITLEDSLFTGEPLLNRDDNEVEIRYVYDNLRRVLSETVAPDTQYTATRRYEYQLSPDTNQQAEQRLFDVKNVQTTSRFDGLGRVIYEARQDADNPDPKRAGELRQTYAAVHDAWGRLAQETVFDWLDQQDLALTSHFDYDDWGEQRCVTGPDGVRTVEETDPIGTAVYRGRIQRSWIESNDLPAYKSESSETWLNLFGEPTRSVRLNLQDQPVSQSQYHYDGLGRRVEEITGLTNDKRHTAFTLDPFDRVTHTTMPNLSVVQRRYAAHSSEDLPTWICVDYNGMTKVLGEQAFDGLDRVVRSVTGGRERLLSYEPGLLQPKTIKLPSGRQIDYRYLPQLGSEPLQRKQVDAAREDVTADYEYDQRNARLMHSAEQGEEVSREYYSTGSLKSEQRISQGQTYSMHYRHSRQGLLLSYTDVLGQKQISHYDAFGRLDKTRLGKVVTLFTYDAFGRTASIDTTDTASNQRVAISLVYDDQGREAQRNFDINGIKQQMVQVYNDLDEMTERTFSEGPVIIRKESYSYDSCGRLTRYDCSGTQPPVDPYGMTIIRQVFSFDGLNNLTVVTTTHKDGRNRAIYHYEGADPAQLTRVTNTQLVLVESQWVPRKLQDSAYPPEILLKYDPDGNLKSDEAGRTLSYDPLGRLLEVSLPPTVARYRYDPQDRLAGETGEQRFYCDAVLTNRLGEGQNSTYMRGDGYLLAEQQGDNALLFSSSISNSVLSEVHPNGVSNRRYTVYGHASGEPPPSEGPGFNGELHEPQTGWQLLGNGYRAYNPVLMRFHSPDSLSPFGEGGLNAYVYVEGDPVNGVDPSGHVTAQQLITRRYGARPQSRSASPGRVVGSSKQSAAVTTRSSRAIKPSENFKFPEGDATFFNGKWTMHSRTKRFPGRRDAEVHLRASGTLQANSGSPGSYAPPLASGRRRGAFVLEIGGGNVYTSLFPQLPYGRRGAFVMKSADTTTAARSAQSFSGSEPGSDNGIRASINNKKVENSSKDLSSVYGGYTNIQTASFTIRFNS